MANENEAQYYHETVTGNKAIADFLGWGKYEDGETYNFPNLYPIYNIDSPENTECITEQISKAEFHTNWAWLMPVIEKIIRTQIEYEDATLSDTYYLRIFGMLNEETGHLMVRFNACDFFEAKKLIDAAWLAVVDFVKWYNYRYSPFK